MKTVILCGGFGTRLSEETILKPKPMVEIGGYPILWHIMKIYGSFQFNDFVLALGYKAEVIKDYFMNYYTLTSNLTVNLSSGKVAADKTFTEDWNIHMVNTGANSMTGGRLLRLKGILENDGTFMLTYGDGISNLDVKAVLEFHKSQKKLATVTAVRPPARFGTMVFDGNKVVDFTEKPQTGEGWINGGFFVFEPGIFDYIEGDDTVLEDQTLSNLAKDGQLCAYKHDGFWHCMDTVRDRTILQNMWQQGTADWKMWK